MSVRFVRPRGTATDMLRLGFNNAIANWPTLLLRGSEKLLAIAVGLGLVAAVGFSSIDLTRIGLLANDSLKRHTALGILAIVVAVLLIIAVSIIVNSFVSAANIRVYLDGYRAALPAMPRPPVAAFRVFRMREWITAGRTSWWRLCKVDLIVGAISLSPIVLFVFPFLLGSHSAGSIMIGCFAAVIFVITILLGWLWGLKADVVCIAVPESSVRDSLHIGWSELMDNLGIHFVTALIITLIFLGTGTIITIVAKVAGIGQALSWVQDIATPVSACWFLASFVALTERALPPDAQASFIEPAEGAPPPDVPASVVEPTEGALPADVPASDVEPDEGELPSDTPPEPPSDEIPPR